MDKTSARSGGPWLGSPPEWLPVVLAPLLVAMAAATRAWTPLLPARAFAYDGGDVASEDAEPGWYSPDEAMAAELAIDGLSFPIGWAQTSDGRLFYTEGYTGRVREVVGERPLDEPVLQLKDSRAWWESALSGLAAHPDFSSEPYLYAYYTAHREVDGQERSFNRLVRFRADAGPDQTPEVLLDDLPSEDYHNGGILLFGPDGKLYVSVGDGHDSDSAQDLSLRTGKILRLNPDGSVPEDNPFPGSPVYALGFRNVFGMAFDPVSGGLYVTENGPDCCDEVNLVRPGGNYGWPNVLGKAASADYVDPLLVFTPCIAPTQAVFYAMPWPTAGPDLLFGDFVRGDLHRVALAGQERDRVAFEAVVYSAKVPVIGLFVGRSGDVFFSTPTSLYRLVPRIPQPADTDEVGTPPFDGQEPQRDGPADFGAADGGPLPEEAASTAPEDQGPQGFAAEPDGDSGTPSSDDGLLEPDLAAPEDSGWPRPAEDTTPDTAGPTELIGGSAEADTTGSDAAGEEESGEPGPAPEALVPGETGDGDQTPSDPAPIGPDGAGPDGAGMGDIGAQPPETDAPLDGDHASPESGESAPASEAERGQEENGAGAADGDAPPAAAGAPNSKGAPEGNDDGQPPSSDEASRPADTGPVEGGAATDEPPPPGPDVAISWRNDEPPETGAVDAAGDSAQTGEPAPVPEAAAPGQPAQGDGAERPSETDASAATLPNPSAERGGEDTPQPAAGEADDPADADGGAQPVEAQAEETADVGTS